MLTIYKGYQSIDCVSEIERQIKFLILNGWSFKLKDQAYNSPLSMCRKISWSWKGEWIYMELLNGFWILTIQQDKETLDMPIMDALACSLCLINKYCKVWRLFDYVNYVWMAWHHTIRWLCTFVSFHCHVFEKKECDVPVISAGFF